MTALTTPTNQSFQIGQPNLERLESATPRRLSIRQIREPNNVIVDFQLYSDCLEECQQSVQSEDQNFGNRRYKFKMMQQREGELSLIVEYRQKIQVLMNKIIQLNQKVYYFEDYNTKLLSQIQIYKQKQFNDILNNQNLKSIIWKKDDTISAQTLVIDTMTIKIQQFQHGWISIKTLEDRIKQKQIKIKDLSKKIDKIILINKNLEDDNKILNDKVLDLQKEAQINAFNQIMQNRSRLKEAIGVTTINKQNLEQNHHRKMYEEGGYRLSLENTYHNRRNKLTNLTTVGNITSPLQRKQKSYSIIGKIKH